MRQTNLESALEATLNQVSGYLIGIVLACGAWWISPHIPWFEYSFDSIGTVLGVGLYLNIIQIINKFCWRRAFNGGSQTRRKSLCEALVSTAFAACLAFLTTLSASYGSAHTEMYGFHTTVLSSMIFTAIMTAVSVGRGYAWRRYFNQSNIAFLRTIEEKLIGRIRVGAVWLIHQMRSTK